MPSNAEYAQRPALGGGFDDVVDAGNRHHGAATWLKLDDPAGEPGPSAAVQRVPQARGCRWRRVALAWVLHNTFVASPIVDPTKPHHRADAVAALDLELTGDEAEALTLYRAQRGGTRPCS